MSISNWTVLKSDSVDLGFHPSDAPWSVQSPSPFEVPSHLRSSYDHNSGCLEIEFKYIENESTDEIKVGQYFVLFVGKKTRRIWMIRFNAHQFNRDRKSIAKETKISLESVSPSDASNGKIAARIIDKAETAIFKSV